MTTFREVFGRAADGVWEAPGRVNLIGEHTDYNDGFVLPLALPRTTRVAAARRDDGVLRLFSRQAAADGAATFRLADAAPPGRGWAAYPLGVAWALREEAGPSALPGADLFVDSTVPPGAGLSSSAALEVATGLALAELHGPAPDRARLAALCRRAENDFAGVPCGVMDQMASACCIEGHALFLDTRDLGRRQVPLDLASHGLRLLVMDTRVRHSLADGAYAERRAGCEEAARLLGAAALRDVPAEDGRGAPADRVADPALRRLVRHVVSENQRVLRTVALLDAGQLRAVGPVLTAGHASLRDDFAVSCPELDLAVGTAVAAGALGARMTGGGFGGSAIALVEDARAATVGEAVAAAFAEAGHREPGIFEALPAAGARRVR
ncbi:galactokinase [Streptomyces sp. TR06-5]|uniref:galactokinase n=1 Tax=Streptomyces sp. TR06-5 TaxID=3385976 RepID=UPI00399FFF83